jgi:hypothetical protein
LPGRVEYQRGLGYMADNASTQGSSSGSEAPKGPATIVLADLPSDREAGGDNPFLEAGTDGTQAQSQSQQAQTETEAPAQTEQEAEPAKDEEKPDADKLILQLLTDQRKHAADKKRFGQAVEAFKAEKAQLEPIRAALANAKAEPMKVLQLVADAAGLDVDTVTDAFVAWKSGAKPELPADHPLKSELQALKDEIAQLKGDKEKETERTDDQLVTAHMGDCRAIAAKDPEKFKLFNADPEVASSEAYDLMVLYLQAEKQGQVDNAGHPIKRITHAQAVERIEATLRKRAARDAELLGIAKPDSTTQSTPASSGTQSAQASAPPVQSKPNTAPRAGAVNARSAPIERVSQIRTDEEIRADFGSGFPIGA